MCIRDRTMIPLTLTIFEKTKGIDVVMYLALGWLLIISIKTLWEVFSRTGVILLISGGIAYTLGVILYGIGCLLYTSDSKYIVSRYISPDSCKCIYIHSFKSLNSLSF